MQSLFPMPQENGNRATAPLFSLKAGKCVMQQQNDGKYLVTSDTRKGKISLTQSNDGLVHFRWENRVSGNLEDDRIVFPHECQLKRVKTGRGDTDRVYLLAFQSGQRLMYWLQDKDSSKDDENVRKINELINNPSAANVAASASSTAGGSAASASFGGLDLSSILGALAMPPPTAAVPSSAANAAPTSSTRQLTSTDLQQALAGSQRPAPVQHPNLQDILSSDGIINSGILNDPEVRRELVQSLPEEQRSEELLEENIRSPQFQQSLGSLSEALRSDGGGASIISNLGFDPSAGSQDMIRGDPVGALLSAAQASVDQETGSSAPGANEPPPPEDQDRMEE